MSARAVSPVTLEVVRHALYAIAEEMSVIVMRSARSPLLKEAGDLSSALTDAEGRLIAQGRDIPMHMGVMGFTVKEFFKRVPAERLQEGDVWFLNLPEVGGNHLPDVKAVRPVFAGGELVAFAINLAHWADIGGAVPGSYVPWATECYQEGVRISPVRLFSAAGPDREKIELILASRGREEREGDIFAQYAANDVAARRLAELIAQYGAKTVRACCARLHAESEAQMRAAIRALPDGAWEGEDWLDDDGVEARPIRIRVRVTIRGDEAFFDFAGTDPQAAGPVNTTPFIACSSVYYAMKALVAPEVPPNDGCYRPLHVIGAPALRAEPRPRPPGGRRQPRDVPARGRRHLQGPGPGASRPDRRRRTDDLGALALRRAPPDGRWAILYEVHGGGEGATAAKDGAAAVRVHMSNVMNTPSEVIEGEYPIMIEEHALRPGSAGDGAHRGGLGFRRAYRVLADGVTLTTMLERRVVPPWGAFGGGDGQPFRITLNPGPAERLVGGKETLTLRRGDLVLVETCGGGGYGSPAARPPEARERDRAGGIRMRDLKDRIAIVTGAAKGMGTGDLPDPGPGGGPHRARRARSRAAGGAGPRDRGARAADAGPAHGRHRRERGPSAGRACAGRLRGPDRHPGQRRGHHRSDRDSGVGDRREGLGHGAGRQPQGDVPAHQARAADDDRAALRQDRQHQRNVGPARVQESRRLLVVEVGAARLHADGGPRSRALQRQRQRPAPGDRGRRPHGQALPREGQEARLDARAGLSGVRRRDGAAPGDRAPRTSPTPSASSPPTTRAT